MSEELEWDEDELFYPERPGHQYGSDTSEAAARSMDDKARVLHNQCLRVLKLAGPRTADEIAADLNRSILAIRPRVTELKRLGLIVDTGERRKNESGRSAAMVAIKMKGWG